MQMPQSLTTVQYPHGSERLPLCHCASSWLQNAASRQIHLTRKARSGLLSEPRETPHHCFGKQWLSSRSPNSSSSTGVKAETTTSTPARRKKRMSSSSRSMPLGRGVIAKRTPFVFIQNGFMRRLNRQAAFVTTIQREQIDLDAKPSPSPAKRCRTIDLVPKSGRGALT
jgi:hypothetical protein